MRLYQLSDELSPQQLVSPIASNQTVVTPSLSSESSTSLQTTSHMTYEMNTNTEQDSSSLPYVQELQKSKKLFW